MYIYIYTHVYSKTPFSEKSLNEQGEGSFYVYPRPAHVICTSDFSAERFYCLTAVWMLPTRIYNSTTPTHTRPRSVISKGGGGGGSFVRWKTRDIIVTSRENHGIVFFLLSPSSNFFFRFSFYYYLHPSLAESVFSPSIVPPRTPLIYILCIYFVHRRRRWCIFSIDFLFQRPQRTFV